MSNDLLVIMHVLWLDVQLNSNLNINIMYNKYAKQTHLIKLNV